MPTTSKLAGKVAVVTGSGRNIGRAVALDLAAAGAAVVVNARANAAEAEGVVKAIEQAGGRAAACLGDVADPATAEKLVEIAIGRFGRLDILVNNAALRRERAFERMSFDEWREVIGIILDGAFLCARACVPHLKASGAGTLINIGGLSGHTGAKARAHVVTAKAGLVGLTRALAQDLGEAGVTVNCVVPGFIDTYHPERKAEPSHYHTSPNILGRKGTPEELSGMVLYLCGPSARYVTGQTFHMNGGAYLG